MLIVGDGNNTHACGLLDLIESGLTQGASFSSASATRWSPPPSWSHDWDDLRSFTRLTVTSLHSEEEFLHVYGDVGKQSLARLRKPSPINVDVLFNVDATLLMDHWQEPTFDAIGTTISLFSDLPAINEVFCDAYAVWQYPLAVAQPRRRPQPSSSTAAAAATQAGTAEQAEIAKQAEIAEIAEKDRLQSEYFKANRTLMSAFVGSAPAVLKAWGQIRVVLHAKQTMTFALPNYVLRTPHSDTPLARRLMALCAVV
jgi:hypothetical protein